MNDVELPILENPPPRRTSSKLRRVLLHAVRVGLVVLIVLLIRWQQVKLEAQRIAETAETIPLEYVTTAFPEADRISKFNPSFGGHLVYDEGDQLLGYALQTSPDANHIIGYSGFTNSVITLTPDNKIAGISIVRSLDTPEHLEAVKNNAAFLNQYQGIPRDGVTALTSVDGVSGATLTSYALMQSIAFKLNGNTPNLKFPNEISVEDAQQFFKQAASVKPTNDRPQLVEVFDQQLQLLGTIFRTSPFADSVPGYQGPTDSLVAMNPTQQIIGIAVRDSFDNQQYVDYVREDYSFPEILNQYNFDQLSSMTLESTGIEGVSGATMTSQAMIEGITKTASELNKPIVKQEVPKFNWMVSTRDMSTILILIFACVIGFTNLRGNKKVRYGFQFFLIAYLGFINGDLVSQALLIGWSQNGIPLGHSFGILFLTAAALLVPLFTKKQIYCHQICPHGAAQHLLKELRIKKWKLSANVKKALLIIVPALWIVITLTAMQVMQLNLAAIEPFDAYAIQVAGWATICVAVVGLLFSLFVPMGYCRYGCPTGSLLNFLRFNSKSDQWNIKDWFAVGLVLLAIGCCLV